MRLRKRDQLLDDACLDPNLIVQVIDEQRLKQVEQEANLALYLLVNHCRWSQSLLAPHQDLLDLCLDPSNEHEGSVRSMRGSYVGVAIVDVRATVHLLEGSDHEVGVLGVVELGIATEPLESVHLLFE